MLQLVSQVVMEFLVKSFFGLKHTSQVPLEAEQVLPG